MKTGSRSKIRRLTFRFISGRDDAARCHEVDLIHCTAARWDKMPQSKDPTWNAYRSAAGVVIALRLTL